MFARVEVTVRPEEIDSAAHGFLRRVELAHPEIRKKIRWARVLDVYWIDVPVTREELIPAITEVCWDPVLQWMFTGNLIPSATGKTGSMEDLMQMSPIRPGKFFGIEKRFRSGVTDAVGRTLLEAFQIVLNRPLPDARASSGSLVILEGAELNEDWISVFARELFCNELIETWTVVSEQDLKRNDRFHQERIKYDLPRMTVRPEKNQDRLPDGSLVSLETFNLSQYDGAQLEKLSQEKLWAFSSSELKAIQQYFLSDTEKKRRHQIGLSDPTDVEMEMLAQTWSEHCKHKIFNAKIEYQDTNSETYNIPNIIQSLFKTTIVEPTMTLMKNQKEPNQWLLSVFSDNAGICSFDEEDAFCVKVETHNAPSALDPYGGALTGIVGVNRDILGCGFGAKPVFNTNVFCVAPIDTQEVLPDRILHPRRILEGVRRGVEHGGNKSGIPTINGALVFDDRYLGRPLVYCGTVGLMPKKINTTLCQDKNITPGDRVCMVGGRIGKDGIHGATFSSLAFDEHSPLSAVQLGDPIVQKRMTDFLLEARDQGLYRAVTDNGAGGLSSSIGEMAQLSGGACIDLSLAKTKYPGLKPYELMVSESQERMTLAVPAQHLTALLNLAERRGVEVSDLGSFTKTGYLEVNYAGKKVADLDLKFLHQGAPPLEIKARWNRKNRIGISVDRQQSNSEKLVHDREAFQKSGTAVLLELLSRPGIASKEWLIRQYDHEVQGTSVVKPLHTVASGTTTAWSGPNDAGVIKPKTQSDLGLAVGCGINPKLSDVDPYWMAQSVVDEAVRNVLCVGSEFGQSESVFSLVDNFCWPDPIEDAEMAGALVRTCYGLRDAITALSVPLISGKDSMKNNFRGKRAGQPFSLAIPPTLLITAVARVRDVNLARTADFKAFGDVIYVLGPAKLGLVGSEFALLGRSEVSLDAENFGVSDWKAALPLYSWLGGSRGKQQSRLRSLHDVSDGGVLVAVAESLLARGMGAVLDLHPTKNPWEFAFGEGFHTFVASASVDDRVALEAEWNELGIAYSPIGTVASHDRLEIRGPLGSDPKAILGQLTIKQIRSAWLKEGYWE